MPPVQHRLRGHKMEVDFTAESGARHLRPAINITILRLQIRTKSILIQVKLKLKVIMYTYI